MVAVFSKPRHVPHFRRSPDAPLPNYKALIIGINYAWSPDGSEPGDPELQLKGPVNDAKDFKEALKGEDVLLKRPLVTAFSLLSISARVDLYRYREQDITLMTDEEGNKGTEMWPSASNIVRSVPTGYGLHSPRADNSKFTVAGDRQTCPWRVPRGCVRVLLYAKNSDATLLSLLDRFP
jgi:hypothetical protein